MKKHILLITVFLFLFQLFIPVYAEDNYVADEARLLTNAEVSDLNEKAKAASDLYDTGIYVRFFSENGSDDIETYAENVYEEENLGIGEDHNGVMLIVTMSDRSYDILAHGDKANRIFTDYGKDQIGDDFITDLSDGNYNDAAYIFISKCSNALYADSKGVDPWHTETKAESKSARMMLIILPPCIISLIICILIARKNKTSRIANKADDYIDRNGLCLRGRQDVFLYQTRSVTHIPKDTGNHGGTSVNSSGYSHSSGHF